MKLSTLKLRPLAHVVLRLVLGGVFLYAGIQKALDPPSAVLAVHGYAVVPGLFVHPVALGLILLEVTLGTLLLLGLFTRFAAGGVAVLSVVFLAVLIQAKVRGLDISCGCFGGSGAGAGVAWLDIVRDLLILAAALFLFVYPQEEPFGLDRFVPRARGLERELRIGVPFLLVVGIFLAALVVPGLTGAMDLPRAAAPGDVSVSGPARTDPLPVGSTLPDFSAPGLFGGKMSSQNYHAVPTVLVLWAAWCPDCREELPLVARVAGEFPGVHLTSIVTAQGELPGPSPEQFMQSHGLSFPVALDSTDGRLADAFGVQGFPTIYYVRADGVISRVTVGATRETDLRAAMQAIS